VSTEEPMSTEDRVRAATRAGATLVRDIGPMAAPDPVRLRRRPAPATRRWGSWGIPLAAAAAVVLVALSLVVVRQLSLKPPAAGGPTPTTPSTVPRYYVAFDIAQNHASTGDLIVGDDVAGQVIATVDPPRGLEFDHVQGTSDDRTFIVVASSVKPTLTEPDTLYLLRIAPGTAHPYQLAKLPIGLPRSSASAVAFALSPDARELAVESLGNVSSNGADTTLALYSVSSGAQLRAWSTSKFGSGPAQETLSWLSDGRQLAFSDVPPGAGQGSAQQDQLRTLDVTGAGTDLLADSRVVLTLKSPGSSPSNCWTMHLTPDGATVICGTQYSFLDGGAGAKAGCANGGLEFTAYSARTGRLVRVLYQYRGACSNGLSSVLWTDASASSIIGATETDIANQGGKQASQLGVITDGHIRPLKLAKSVSPADYGTIAF
jgi:hypothetical protein